jgi:hypothetical protein
MKKVFLLIAFVFLFLPFCLIAQNSISIQAIGNLSSLDPGAFLLTNNVGGQPRIFSVTVVTNPTGRSVYVKGVVRWKENLNASYQELLNFTTEPFTSRSFFNDELGTSDIKVKNVQANQSLGTDLASRGKPVGQFEIYMELYDQQNVKIAYTQPSLILLFLNPTAPTINLPVYTPPTPSVEFTVGNIQVSWTTVDGVIRYKVKVCEMGTGQGLQEALESSDPVVDADVGFQTSVNLINFKRREFLENKNYVIKVTAVVFTSGRENELDSEPRAFTIKGAAVTNPAEINPDIKTLAEFLSQRNIDTIFINALNNGEITVDQIQITDENNVPITFSDFMTNILTPLKNNPEKVISVNYAAK